jgi:peptidylamidoglycolate lyase
MTILMFAVGLAVTWLAARSVATPPPTGETYRAVPNWPRLPEGISLGQVSGVAVDSHGDVFVFQRAERIWQGEDFGLDLISGPTLLVLDDETGELLGQWGANQFVIPHGLTIDHEDNLWLTDVGLHQVFKFDRAGDLLMTLGERGVAGSDESHFNQPTDVAVAPDGSFYVSDGYGNARILKFTADGELLTSWGVPGTERGQFDVPHSIALDAQGQVYVADRGNARLQIFDGDGKFISEWKNEALGRPWAVRISPAGDVYVVDGGDQNEFWPDRARVLKLNSNGEIVASFGSSGREPGQFIWPHTLALGPNGEIYIGEVSTGMRIQKFIK